MYNVIFEKDNYIALRRQTFLSVLLCYLLIAPSRGDVSYFRTYFKTFSVTSTKHLSLRIAFNIPGHGRKVYKISYGNEFLIRSSLWLSLFHNATGMSDFIAVARIGKGAHTCND
jgi:hypothetical protein